MPLQRWMLKVAVQFLLAHVVGGEHLNYRFQRLSRRHSAAAVAKRIPNYAARLHVIDRHKSLEGATILEIGTGWEPISAFLFYLLGARHIHTYDHVRHLRLPLVQLVVATLIAQSSEIADILGRPHAVVRDRLASLNANAPMEDLLAAAHIHYHAPSDAAVSGLTDSSVDCVYSYAVLEHVPEDVILELTWETSRVLKSEGIAYHGIGIQDHYSHLGASKVNFLRYPEWAWRFFVQNKISYHNRMRERNYLDIFRSAGARFERVWSEIDEADISLLREMKIDRRFAGFSLEELAVTHSEVIMTFGVGTQVAPVFLTGRPSPGTGE